MSSEGRRWTIAVDLDWPDSAVVVDEDSPRRQGFVYYEVEPVGESASEVERLRKALDEARPYVYNRTQGDDWRAETARDILSRVDAALADEKEEA